jgi:proteasome alpha subunit
MNMPFYVSPEQVMKDRADYARKGIARGRSLVAVVYTGGILICAENTSNTLHKVSEIYDRIAFAGVGRYNEFDSLRVAGVRAADLKGYSYSREDVDARGLASQYGQILNNIFTHELKPMEVEILVEEVAGNGGPDALYHVLYDGSVLDDPRCRPDRCRGAGCRHGDPPAREGKQRRWGDPREHGRGERVRSRGPGRDRDPAAGDDQRALERVAPDRPRTALGDPTVGERRAVAGHADEVVAVTQAAQAEPEMRDLHGGVPRGAHHDGVLRAVAAGVERPEGATARERQQRRRGPVLVRDGAHDPGPPRAQAAHANARVAGDPRHAVAVLGERVDRQCGRHEGPRLREPRLRGCANRAGGEAERHEEADGERGERQARSAKPGHASHLRPDRRGDAAATHPGGR